MYRQANEPFTWSPQYAPSDIAGYYARIRGVYQTFDTEAELCAYCVRHSAGFYERGVALRPGAEPTHWTVDPAFVLLPHRDERTGRVALGVA